MVNTRSGLDVASVPVFCIMEYQQFLLFALVTLSGLQCVLDPNLECTENEVILNRARISMASK